MSNQETGILERLASASLEKCLLKISAVSGMAWQLTDINISRGNLGHAVSRHSFSSQSAAVVYIHVNSEFPFMSLMVFDQADVGHISKCFLGESLARAGNIEQFNEVMLLELGNIMLNAVINYFQNALRKSAIPSVPMFMTGNSGHIAAGLGAYMDSRQIFRIITAAVSVGSGQRVSRGAVLAVIPEELAAALERC